jgi:hypothetical protein
MNARYELPTTGISDISGNATHQDSARVLSSILEADSAYCYVWRGRKPTTWVCLEHELLILP